MLTLDLLNQGAKARIVKVDAGKGLLRQLKHMGLHEGDEIQVIQNSRGPIILAKENMRVALGRGISQKIFVEEVKKQAGEDAI